MEGFVTLPHIFNWCAFKASQFWKGCTFFAHNCPPPDQSEMKIFDVYFDVKLIISQPITASKDFGGYKMIIKTWETTFILTETFLHCFYSCILLKTHRNCTSKTNTNKTPAKENKTWIYLLITGNRVSMILYLMNFFVLIPCR